MKFPLRSYRATFRSVDFLTRLAVVNNGRPWLTVCSSSVLFFSTREAAAQFVLVRLASAASCRAWLRWLPWEIIYAHHTFAVSGVDYAISQALSTRNPTD